MVAEVMANYYSWEKFARNMCGNVEDDDMQVVLMSLGRLVDLSEQNFYPSLREVPRNLPRFAAKSGSSAGLPWWWFTKFAEEMLSNSEPLHRQRCSFEDTTRVPSTVARRHDPQHSKDDV